MYEVQLIKTMQALNEATKQMNLLMEQLAVKEQQLRILQIDSPRLPHKRPRSKSPSINQDKIMVQVVEDPKKRNKCFYCKKLHPSRECRTYPTQDQRNSRIRRMGLCRVCLLKEHPKRCDDWSSIKYCLDHDQNIVLCGC